MSIRWEAEKYASDFNFVPQYGRDLIKLIEAPKGSRVLDLGCGHGTLTNALAEAGFCVSGLDASAELIALARKNYPTLQFEEGDATHFSVSESVDVVFSNAVFHWIDRAKQPLLAQCIADALLPGGELVCEFGGLGNDRLIFSALEDVFAHHCLKFTQPFYFPSIAEHASVLEHHGLRVRFAVLFDRLTELKGRDGMTDWIRMFVKQPFSGIDKGLETEIVRETVEKLNPVLCRNGVWYADYVRIRLRAVKL